MKAEIDENGGLEITAETSVEAFALSIFWKDFSADGNCKQYTIGIDVNSYKNIRNRNENSSSSN